MEPEQLLMVHLKTFPGEQEAQTTIAEPTSFILQRAQPVAYRIIILIPFRILKD